MLIGAAWLAMSSLSYASGNEVVHKIRYPKVKNTTIYLNQANYFIDVLKLALERSAVNYEVEFVNIPTLAQSRSQSLLKQGFYDIHWLTTNIERETILKPIRIPLYKGLLGLRIAFVNSSKGNLFAKTTKVDDLKKIYAGQGRDWVDSKILNFHGFKLMESSTTTALFDMLQINRIDYFPRSILEIWWEAEQTEAFGLTIDPYVALYYPEAVYFFVSNDNTELYNNVLKGLNKAIEDGSFQQNFERYFGEYIERAQLHKRQIFTLSNPYIPAQTPLNEAHLWHNLNLQKTETE